MRSAAKAAIKSAIAEGGSFADITPIEGINFASTSRAAGEEGIRERMRPCLTPATLSAP